MVGMASRLTAEPGERPGRAQMLAEARSRQAISGYSGVRIDSAGRRFQIRGARLWTLWSSAHEPIGQAASFSDWWWICRERRWLGSARARAAPRASGPIERCPGC
jgi:hypothetical protein